MAFTVRIKRQMTGIPFCWCVLLSLYLQTHMFLGWARPAALHTHLWLVVVTVVIVIVTVIVIVAAAKWHRYKYKYA